MSLEDLIDEYLPGLDLRADSPPSQASAHPLQFVLSIAIGGEFGEGGDVGGADVSFDAPPTTNQSSYTYRGSSTSPDVVFDEGFAARGSSTDPYDHALDNTNPPSAYVSMSQSPAVAELFGPNVYVVRPSGGINVKQTLGHFSPFPDELEIAIPNKIAPSDIRAVTLPAKGVSILNPHWQPWAN